jgi:uncharacterized membrane protein
MEMLLISQFKKISSRLLYRMFKIRIHKTILTVVLCAFVCSLFV